MLAERALEILVSIRNEKEIIISTDELQQLQENALIHIVQDNRDPTVIKQDLQSEKEEFLDTSNSLRKKEQELFIDEKKFNEMTIGTRVASHLGIGQAASIRKSIVNLKKEIHHQEAMVNAVRDRMIAMNLELEKQASAVQVDGHKVTLLPFGNIMIDEIQARQRFLQGDFANILSLTNKLDKQFTSILDQIEAGMKSYKKIAFWIPYLVNLDKLQLANYFQMSLPAFESEEKSYEELGTAQWTPYIQDRQTKKFLLQPLGLQTSQSLRGLNLLYKSINNLLSIPYEIEPIIDILDTLLNHSVSDYLEKFQKIIAISRSGNILGRDKTLLDDQVQSGGADRFTKDEFCAILLLALSDNPERFLYFINKFDALPDGKLIFSAVCALFPWDPEETWSVLLRAESTILKTQGAKFVPELLEYAILISINTDVLSIENNLSSEYIAWWKRFVIPIVQAVFAFVIEEDLKDFVEARPLSFITTPHYHGHMYLHTHHFGHYHTRG